MPEILPALTHRIGSFVSKVHIETDVSRANDDERRNLQNICRLPGRFVSERDGKEALRPGKEFRAGAEREATMRAKEREPARMRLDHELRYYRLAGREKRPTQQLLRRVRQVLGLRSSDLAREVGVNRSVLFRLEDSEARGTISLNAMTRVAQAMGCKVVYAVTPRNGLTLQEMVERYARIGVSPGRGNHDAPRQ